MKQFAQKFYKSRNWKETRKAFLSSIGGLCQICLKEGKYTPAVIVHHKIEIDENTINDPHITLSWDNLLAVCRKHHEEIHRREILNPSAPGEIVLKPPMMTPRRRYKIDEITGEVTMLSD